MLNDFLLVLDSPSGDEVLLCYGTSFDFLQLSQLDQDMPFMLDLVLKATWQPPNHISIKPIVEPSNTRLVLTRSRDDRDTKST